MNREKYICFDGKMGDMESPEDKSFIEAEQDTSILKPVRYWL